MAHSIFETWLLQSAIFGAVILAIGSLSVRILEQPVHRIGAIQWTCLACLAVPAVQQLNVLPHLSVNLIAADTARMEAAAINAGVAGAVVLDSSSLNTLDEPQIETVARSAATNQLSKSSVDNPKAALSERVNASGPPQATTWFTWSRLGWVAKWTYLTVVAGLAVLWAVGVYLLGQLSKQPNRPIHSFLTHCTK